MQAVPPEEERFAANAADLASAVHEFIALLHSQGYDVPSPGLVEMAACILNSIDKYVLIDGFISRSHKHWENIRLHEKNFFLTNANNIFAELSVENVGMFSKIFELRGRDGKSVVSKEREEDYWYFFETLVKIAIKYIHKRRVPYSRPAGNGVINSYTYSFFDDVDVSAEAQLWNIVLDWPLRTN